MIRRLVLALLFSLTAIPTAAGEARLGQVTVSDAWARASIGPGSIGVAFFTLHNGGERPVQLLAPTTPVAGQAKLHASQMVDGVMKMRPLENPVVGPGETLRLAPGGNHVMLMDLVAPLKQGSSFPLTLDLGEAGKLEVMVEVQSATADGPAPE